MRGLGGVGGGGGGGEKAAYLAGFCFLPPSLELGGLGERNEEGLTGMNEVGGWGEGGDGGGGAGGKGGLAPGEKCDGRLSSSKEISRHHICPKCIPSLSSLPVACCLPTWVPGLIISKRLSAPIISNSHCMAAQ